MGYRPHHGKSGSLSDSMTMLSPIRISAWPIRSSIVMVSTVSAPSVSRCGRIASAAFVDNETGNDETGDDETGNA
jgi:hypothetical protein